MNARLRLFLMVSLGVLGGSCRGGAKDTSDLDPVRVDPRGRVVLTPAQRKSVDLQVAAVSVGTLTTSALRFAQVVGRPEEDALVVAPLTGRLLAPPLALGSRVSAGDVLLRIEPLVDTASRATLEAQRRELQGQFESARAQVGARKAELARVTSLVSSGLATDSDRAQALAGLTSEQALLESFRRAGGALAQLTSGRVELRAPVSGVVATLATEAGALVQQGAIVARIVRAGPRWLDLAVPPGSVTGDGYRVQGLGAGMPLRLLTKGAVVQTDGTRRDRLEASADAGPSLLPGATVPVEVLFDASGVLVPTSAIVRRGRDSLVFVETEAGTFEPRKVSVAARDDARAVVSSGLTAGEQAVSQGAASLLGELGASSAPLDGGAQE